MDNGKEYKQSQKILVDNDEEEIYEIIKNSAVLRGLDNSKQELKVRPIARWKFPEKYKKMSSSQIKEIRRQYKIDVIGNDILPPIANFSDMKFPEPILKALEKQGIFSPTAIQIQGLPIVLSGRDLVAIANTGSGKTLLYLLPAIMLALYEESKERIKKFDGPFAVIVVPSRELGIQIYEVLNYYLSFILRFDYPLISSVLCIGGVDIRNQIEDIVKGVHIVIGTPGRLSDLLEKKKLDVKMCKLLVLDEADRLFDMGFDDEIKKVLEKFKIPKQTILLSSTMPKKIQEFAMQSLQKSVGINVGRAGAANLNVLQEIEYVKEESKLLHILDTIQKTPPPVLIFCENKNDVDEINEYLLLKGVDAAGIHGEKDQDERNNAIKEFREGVKDVLIATDIVSKGLDFKNIEHVINYDMPKEIENYVLRIGRTGRYGKRGLATTYVNRNQDEAILLDLKHLLLEANQILPSFLMSIPEEDISILKQECSFCGGLGHKPNQCHKLENQRLKAMTMRISIKPSDLDNI